MPLIKYLYSPLNDSFKGFQPAEGQNPLTYGAKALHTEGREVKPNWTPEKLIVHSFPQPGQIFVTLKILY